MNKVSTNTRLITTITAILLLALLAGAGAPIEASALHSPQQASGPLINEFIATPTGAEMVELCNPTDATISVGGWTLDWEYGDATLNDGLSIPAHSYLVIDDSNTSGISISNAGTVLTLKDGTTIYDTVGYGKAGGAPKPEYNYSTARTIDCTDTNNDAVDWNTDQTPTEGAVNDAPASALGSTTVTINEVQPGNNGFIELYNSGDSAVDLSGWRLSVDDSYDIPAGTSIASHGYWVLDSDDYPHFFSVGDTDNVYLFNDQKIRVDQIGWNDNLLSAATAEQAASSWNRLPDGNGSNDGWTQSMTPLTSQAVTKNANNQGSGNSTGDTANAGDVLINEFIVTPTRSEAIELCNTTGSALDLSGWEVRMGMNTATVNAGVSLPANGYVVLNDTNTSGIGLANAGSTLVIADVAGTSIDDVAYGNTGGAPKAEYEFSTARVPNCATTGDDAADFNVDESPTLGAANDGPAANLGAGTITINEVNAKAGEQFIELYNSGDGTVDISGWRISVDDSYDIPAGTSIAAQGFWVLDAADFPHYFNMGESGDNVYLFNNVLERVDQVGWDQAAGSSWNRLPNGAGHNNGWQQAQIPLYAQAPTRNASNGQLTTMLIHEVQGASHLSPYASQTVTNVYGIVTVLDRRGFWMQTPDEQADALDATSEGIYVYANATPTVVPGDEVVVSGSVSEYYPGGYSSGNLSITEITHPSVQTLSQGNMLPTPVILGDGGRIPPSQIIDDDSTGDVNSTPSFDPENDGIDFYESVEGMLVQVNDAVAVAPTSKYGEITVVGDNGAHAGVRTPRGGITVRPDDFNPERIIFDDALVSNEPIVTTGDKFTAPLVGVVSFSYGNFKVLNPLPMPSVQSANLAKEVTTPANGLLTVATFNVENLDPGDSDTKFQQLGEIIATNMQAPDIIGIEEVQDNNGSTNDGTVDASASFQALIAAIQAAGGPLYDFRQINPVNNADGGQPGGNIRVGFLFRPDRVSFVDRPGGDATTAVDVVPTPGGAALTLSPGRIDPNNIAFAGDVGLDYHASRKSIVGEFSFQGYKLFVIVNHFKSKGGDDGLFGRVQPPVQNTLPQRVAQAQVIHEFAQKIVDTDPNAKVVIVGDLNDFDFSDALTALKGSTFTNLVERLPREERYSFIFGGNSQQLDHILASPSMASDATKIDVVHVNSEYPGERASDHDPVVATFDVPIWRFDGFVYQGAPNDESMPQAGVTVRLYGRNAGEAAPGSWYKEVTTSAGGYFNFHIIQPYNFDTFTLTALPPAGMVSAGAWSDNGTVTSQGDVQWQAPDTGTHRAKLWFDAPTPTPTPTPSMVWLPIYLTQ